MEPHFFDPDDSVAIVERKLPHWSQAGVLTFITFRLHDSMPADVVERWRQERFQWLRKHGINPRDPSCQSRLLRLPKAVQQEFHSTFSGRWHEELDRCHGSCVLRNSANANVVAESLLKFDNDRYVMSDFVVMPNHVHLLAAFKEEDSMLNQCESWKRFTGRQINAELGASGRFWQQDGFDHLIRSADWFDYYRTYIAENPRKAGLNPGEFMHHSVRLK